MKASSQSHRRAACGLLAISLLLAGCSAIGSIQSARASASSTAAVAHNIPLCEVTNIGETEEKLGQQVQLFFYEHSNDSLTGSSYGCWIQGFSTQPVEVDKLEVKYKQRTELDEVDVPALDDAHTYAEAATLDRTTRFALDNVKGEGVTIPLKTKNWAEVWQYPDGSILTVLIEHNSDVDKISNGSSIARSITELFAPKVPQVAAGPTQELTFYPANEDTARVLGIHDGGATPLTPWPSSSP